MYTANNPIEFAYNKLSKTIPMQILETCFFDTSENKTDNAKNLYQRIREEVIDPIVMSDLNTLGGKVIPLDILPGWMNKISPRLTIIRIPKNFTQNRTINNVYSTTFGVSAISNLEVGVANNASSQVLGAAKRVFNSGMQVPYVSTANVTVHPENVIEVRDHTSLPTRVQCKVRLNYDENFTDLQQPFWIRFAELCGLALKAYIYTKLIVQMDRAFLQGGVEMGRMSAKVEEWSDAEETYQDTLHEKWQRLLTMNDPRAKNSHIIAITNP